MSKKIVTNFTEKELAQQLEKIGLERYRAGQIFRWIYKKGIFDFEKMTDIPKEKVNLLKENFEILNLSLIGTKISSDKTIKLLIKLSDGYCIESVLLKDQSPGRFTACISSQVGCALGCKFCLSGKFMFKRNLTPSEVVGQLVLMRFLKKQGVGTINNIVFMGMGEPLLNYDNVLKTIDIVSSKNSFNIGSRKITISTSGIVPGIGFLAKEKKQLRLSVSLHSPKQEIREKIMPISAKYPLKEVMSAIKEYNLKTSRQVTFEYILIDNLNNSKEDLVELIKLVRDIDCSINLIPYNKIDAFDYNPPSLNDQYLFKKGLERRGIKVTLRKRKGEDITASCGQLALKLNENEGN